MPPKAQTIENLDLVLPIEPTTPVEEQTGHEKVFREWLDEPKGHDNQVEDIEESMPIIEQGEDGIFSTPDTSKRMNLRVWSAPMNFMFSIGFFVAY